MSTAQSRVQFGYAQIESAFGVINNSTGAATVANGDAFRLNSLQTDGDIATVQRTAKTGTLSITPGIPGRAGGSWSASVEVAGSGAAGTAPDIDQFLQALMGKAATVVSSTSVTYALDDLSPSLSIWNYRDPSTMVQQVAFGAVVNSCSLSVSDSASALSFSGDCKYVLDSIEYLALADGDARKGGLTTAGQAAFPVRPSSPTFAGTMALGLYGGATINGVSYSTVRSMSLQMNMARSLQKNLLFNGALPGSPQQGVREVSVSFELTDTDVAALATLKGLARAKTAVDMSFSIGATAGNILTVNLNDVILASPRYSDSQDSWGVQFSGRASASSATAKDEVTLVWT